MGILRNDYGVIKFRWAVTGVISALIATVLGATFGIAGCGNRINYGEGIRVGQVTKVSRRGLIWKTYEAQMNTGGALKGEGNNVIPEVWKFSLDESRRNGENIENLVKALENAARTGERVEVKYKQYLAPAPWNGGSSYYAQEVRTLRKEAEKPESE